MQFSKLLRVTAFSCTLILQPKPIFLQTSLSSDNAVTKKETISRPFKLIGEIISQEDYKIAKIKSLKGKYRNVLSPTEEFISEKRRTEL